jgi:hypothetical protein
VPCPCCLTVAAQKTCCCCSWHGCGGWSLCPRDWVIGLGGLLDSERECCVESSRSSFACRILTGSLWPCPVSLSLSLSLCVCVCVHGTPVFRSVLASSSLPSGICQTSNFSIYFHHQTSDSRSMEGTGEGFLRKISAAPGSACF